MFEPEDGALGVSPKPDDDEAVPAEDAKVFRLSDPVLYLYMLCPRIYIYIYVCICIFQIC